MSSEHLDLRTLRMALGKAIAAAIAAEEAALAAFNSTPRDRAHLDDLRIERLLAQAEART